MTSFVPVDMRQRARPPVPPCSRVQRKSPRDGEELSKATNKNREVIPRPRIETQMGIGHTGPNQYGPAL